MSFYNHPEHTGNSSRKLADEPGQSPRINQLVEERRMRMSMSIEELREIGDLDTMWHKIRRRSLPDEEVRTVGDEHYRPGT